MLGVTTAIKPYPIKIKRFIMLIDFSLVFFEFFKAVKFKNGKNRKVFIKRPNIYDKKKANIFNVSFSKDLHNQKNKINKNETIKKSSSL